MYSLFFLSYLCFSTASSRKAKEAASVNLQPLQTNLKVLQEQQTQRKHSMLSPSPLVNSPRRASARLQGILLQANRASEAALAEEKSTCRFIEEQREKPHAQKKPRMGTPAGPMRDSILLTCAFLTQNRERNCVLMITFSQLLLVVLLSRSHRPRDD